MAENFTLPIYQIFYKEITLAGIPVKMGILTIAGMGIGLGGFHSLAIFLFFLVLHLIIFILLKSTKRFDTKILDILVRRQFKRYISY